MAYFGNITDPTTNKSLSIDSIDSLQIAAHKRIIGSYAGMLTNTTYYTPSVSGTGAAAVSNGEYTLTTGATANSTASVVSIPKARALSGKPNIFRGVFRFSNTGSANNVRQFGIFVDSNNMFVFRLSGTTFSVVTKKAGSETVVNSGSFNGNGTGSAGTYTVDTDYHAFEIMYLSSKIRFVIDDVPIHVVSATSTSLVGGVAGNLYASNANSGGGTANVSLGMLAWSVNYLGDSVNNPQWYCNSATAETKTLKTGGGTLYSVTIGRAGGANCTLTIYDNTAGSGTLLAIFDMTKDQAIGTHNLAPEGVNFYTGLTYVLSATATAAAFTITWD